MFYIFELLYNGACINNPNKGQDPLQNNSSKGILDLSEKKIICNRSFKIAGY